MYRVTAALLLTALTFPGSHLTNVVKCKDKDVKPPNAEEVSISECAEPPCRLRKGKMHTLEMIIRPEKDVKELMTKVHAEIFNIVFPFLGVDGASACNHIYSEDGKTQLSCPLKAGTTYLYKTGLKVYQIYPNVNANIQWGLAEKETGDYISCFEVKGKIA